MFKILGCLDKHQTEVLNDLFDQPFFVGHGVFLTGSLCFDYNKILPGIVLTHSPTIKGNLWQSSMNVFKHTDDFGFPESCPNTIAIPVNLSKKSKLYLEYQNNRYHLSNGLIFMFNATLPHELIDDRSSSDYSLEEDIHVNWVIFDQICRFDKLPTK